MVYLVIVFARSNSFFYGSRADELRDGAFTAFFIYFTADKYLTSVR